MGVYPAALPESLRTKLGLAHSTGILVLNVEKGGPADRAGVLLGDVLIALDSTPMEKVEDLQTFCASGVMGNAVKAKFIRGGALAESNIVLGERPRA